MASKETIANLGLIGYILLLIGSLLGLFVFGIIVGFIGWIMVGVSWFLLGGWARSSSLKIIGLILILAPIAAIVTGIIGVFIAVSSSAIIAANASSNAGAINVSTFINTLIAAIVIALEVYMVGEFFHVVAHYKAYKLLNISTFKYAMFTWGAAFIARIIAMFLIIQAISRILPAIISGSIGTMGEAALNNTSPINISGGPLPEGLTAEILSTIGSALLAGIIGFILGIIASIISMLAFNAIKNIVLEEPQPLLPPPPTPNA